MTHTEKSNRPARTSATTWVVVTALGILAVVGIVGVSVVQNMVWFE